MVTHTAQFVGAILAAWEKRWAFLMAFLTIFFVSFSVLIALDLVPQEASEDSAVSLVASPLVSATSLSPNVIDAFSIGELPIEIDIPAIGVSATIANPNSTDVATLDKHLLSGAVRYPGSGLLGKNGN